MGHTKKIYSLELFELRSAKVARPTERGGVETPTALCRGDWAIVCWEDRLSLTHIPSGFMTHEPESLPEAIRCVDELDARGLLSPELGIKVGSRTMAGSDGAKLREVILGWKQKQEPFGLI